MLKKKQVFGTKKTQSRFEFTGGAKKNPLRVELLVFGAFQVYFFVTCHIPWPIFTVATDEGMGGSGENSNSPETEKVKGSRSDCLITMVIRVVSLLIQALNMAAWLRRTSFDKKWHFIHWNIGNLCLFLTMPLLRSFLKSQLILYVDFMSVTSQVCIFAYIAALTPLHGIIAVFTVVVIQIGIFSS